MTPEEMQRLMAEAQVSVTSIAPGAALDLLADEAVVFLDVREDQERAMGYIPGASHVTLGALQASGPAGEGLDIPADKKVLVYCASGMRSLLAAKLLQDKGFVDAQNLAGGIQGWFQIGGEITR